MSSSTGTQGDPPQTLDVVHESESILDQETHKAQEESDTCRICRGEGTQDEPLFYPCKCSGSIKFVHQDCLMEWLSHSQKKHCELCKTSFRFTKLYDPRMPRTLPTSIFLTRASLHAIKNFFTWCRGILVACVWLFWLPWSMRFVWWGLFWIADGQWIQDMEEFGNRAAVTEQALHTIRNSNENQTALQNSNSTLSTLASVNATHSLPSGPWRYLLHQLDLVFSSTNLSSVSTDTLSNSHNATQLGTHTSLLSGLAFFESLTPSPFFNKLTTDILEGQMITLCVVVAFVLVFLIREWVVQQQPVINMAAVQPLEDNEQDNAPAIDPPQVEGAAIPMAAEADPNMDEQERGNVLLDQDEQAQQDRAQVAAGDESTQEGENHFDDQSLIGTIGMNQTLHDDAEISDRYSTIANSDSDEVASQTTLSRETVQRSENTGMANTTQWNWTISSPNTSDPVESGQSRIPAENMDQYGEVGGETSRPSMPGRSQSSVVSEIQRALEETVDLNDNELNRQESLSSQEPLNNGSNNHHELILDQSETHISSSNSIINSNNGESSVSADGDNDDLEGVARSDLPRPSPEIGRANAPSQLSTNDNPDKRVRFAEPSETDAREAFDSHNHENHEPLESSSMLLPPDPSSSQDHVDVSQGETQNNDEEEPPRVHRNVADRVLDIFWGNVVDHELGPEIAENAIHLIEGPAEEPLIPVVNGHAHHHHHADDDDNNEEAQDPEVLAAAAQAGLNPDADDVDIEDLEGLMELIGMQGPFTGLIQNAVFSAVLISATVASAVCFPYLWGKVVLLFLAQPIQFAVKVPLQAISAVTNFVLDLSIVGVAHALSFVITVTYLTSSAIRLVFGTPQMLFLATFDGWLRELASNAIVRVASMFFSTNDESVAHVSINAHAALRAIEDKLTSNWENSSQYFRQLNACISQGRQANFSCVVPLTVEPIVSIFQRSLRALAAIPDIIKSEGVSFTMRIRTDAATLENLDQWTTTDRLITIFAGYAFFALAGSLYLRSGSPLATSQQGRKVESVITEILQQAGGVMKVILIISIEMLIFPLYCGFLLDFAMLPLFEGVTFQSRLAFTMSSPWTSSFLHWFLGTCYMFHFALFVSMCRQLMRSGVLYFIRDPDDPTFHPVRDVLERSVSSQLRKIGFSAIVYGGLVIVCMGSVIWAVSCNVFGILPLKWTSSKPIIDFPVDLLLYNILTPFVARFFRSSIGLSSMYDWWFRRCAQFLHINTFLFDKATNDQTNDTTDEQNLSSNWGKLVRVPASDKVRVPKGQSVFIEVDEDNNRLDGKPDTDFGAQGRKSKLNRVIRIPSWFRVRICLFIVLLWAMTTFCGLSATILPLLIGRYILGRFVMPPDVRLNDVYAFSLGLLVLGTTYYLCLNLRRTIKLSLDRHNVNIPLLSPPVLSTTLLKIALRIFRVFYTYLLLTFLLPVLLAILLEFYFVMPLHAYITPTGGAYPHTMHLIQDWTLGVLYLRICIRLVQLRPNSRPSRAMRAVVARGWLDPDAALITRAFAIPALILTGIALVSPLLLGTLAIAIFAPKSKDESPDVDILRIQIRRFAYPALLAAVGTVWTVVLLIKAGRSWRLRIRDEVYLIGERLHNFGESRPPVRRKMTETGSVGVGVGVGVNESSSDVARI